MHCPAGRKTWLVVTTVTLPPVGTEVLETTKKKKKKGEEEEEEEEEEEAWRRRMRVASSRSAS